MRPERDCFVYVFGPLGGPFKIGHAYNLKQRASGERCLRTQNGPTPEIKQHAIHWHSVALPDKTEAEIVERAAHSRLDRKRILNPNRPWHRKRCEWFSVSVTTAIKTIEKALADNLVTIEVDEDQMKRLDEWRAKQTVPPTRTEALRVAIEKLIAKGK